MARTGNGAFKGPGMWAGAGFVVFWFLGIIVLNIAGTSPFPQPSVSPAEAQEWFQSNETATVLSSVLQILSAVALLWFAALLAQRIERDSHDGSASAQFTLAGGVSAAVMVILTGAIQFVAADADVASDLATVQSLRGLSFLTGGALHVVLLGVMVWGGSHALARSGAIPTWLSRLGIFTVVVAILSLVSMLFDAAVYLIPAGRFLCFIWIVAAAVVINRSRGVVPDRGRTTASP